MIESINELEQIFDNYHQQHVEINHFGFGGLDDLAKTKKNAAYGEIILFIEYPDIEIRDRSGSLDHQFITGLVVCGTVNPGDREREKAMYDQCYHIILDILIRLRKDAFENDYHVEINEGRNVEPIIYDLYTDLVGARKEITVGDWVSIGVDILKWDDL